MNIKYILFQYLLISVTLCNANKLYDAVIDEDILEVQKILTSKTVNINEQNDQGYTILHFLTGLTEENDYTIAKMLIDAGANPNIQDHWGNTPLHQLIFFENLFIDEDEPELENTYKDLINLYIQSMKDINIINKAEETPLLRALIHKRHVAAKLLLSSSTNIDVNAQDDGMVTALDIAAMDNAVEIAKLLIDRGAHINNCDNHDHATALHYAILSDAFEVAQLLITSGANVTIRDKFGFQPYSYCKTKKMRDLFIK